MALISKEDVDFGKNPEDYAKHRAGFPDSFFQRLDDLEIFQAKAQVLDLGTGTGTVARGLFRLGLEVTGLDPSPELIAQAVGLNLSEATQITYALGRAEATPFAPASFDFVTAGQCWHWFDHDQVVKEVRRVLRPHGLLIVAYFDWLERSASPVALMYELQKKYNPDWHSVWPLGFYPQQPSDLYFPDFDFVTAFSYEENIAYTHAGWRGRMRAYAGIGGSLPKAAVDAFDKEFAEELNRRFPDEPMQIPHKVWAGVWRI